jgi:hypothetical protein
MINDQIPEVMKSCVKKGGGERQREREVGGTMEIGNMWWASVNMMKLGTKIKKMKCENVEDMYLHMYEVAYNEKQICTANVRTL